MFAPRWLRLKEIGHSQLHFFSRASSSRSSFPVHQQVVWRHKVKEGNGWMQASQVLERRKWDQINEGIRKTDVRVLLAELKVCSTTRNLSRGKEIHAETIGSGIEPCIYVATALVNMYAKCGSMGDAQQVFDTIRQPNVVSWTALIWGYAENGKGFTALDLFERMKTQGCIPNSITIVAALKACTSLAVDIPGTGRMECLYRGRQIHSESGGHSEIFAVQSTLICMYAKCGSMVDARQVFDRMTHPDVVSWTALILGYADNGDGVTALDLFAEMRFKGFEPDSVTFVAALKACTSLVLEPDGRTECLERGRKIHSEIRCLSDICVPNTLIDMYAKCASMCDARHVFDSIKHPDVVSWTALILGYADNGEGLTALDLFSRMRCQGHTPDTITFVAAFKACALLGAVDSGSKIHAEMDTATQSIIVTSLVDFYSKCGNLMKAQKVFDAHPEKRDLRTWTALLAGYSRSGDDKTVFKLFEELQDAGFQPSAVTFLCILACCCHAGLLERATEFFEIMSKKYGVNPNLEHYNCMVDILGRSNNLDDAIALLRDMPCNPNAVTWMTMLGACREWKNVGIGRLAFKSLVNLNDTYAASYMLMGHIYGSVGMWEEQEIVLGMRNALKS